MFIQSHSLPLCKRDIDYKYLGKSLSLCGEDEKQIDKDSLKLDMKKRSVTFAGPQGRNFLGYELDENGTLKCKTSFGCQSDCVDLLRYTRKIAVNLEYRNDSYFFKNGTEFKPLPTLQKALYNNCINNLFPVLFPVLSKL